MAKQKNYRTFLEPASSGTDSYVQVRVYSDDEIDLTVADCGDRVTLSFGVWGYKLTEKKFAARKKRKLQKLERMEKALAIIREHLEAMEYRGDEDE